MVQNRIIILIKTITLSILEYITWLVVIQIEQFVFGVVPTKDG